MRSFLLAILSSIVASIPSSHAFHASRGLSSRNNARVGLSLSNKPIVHENDADTTTKRTSIEKSITSSLAAATILLGAATSSWAVSGGGLDYAGLDISGQDFSNGNYKGKDFTQVSNITTFVLLPFPRVVPALPMVHMPFFV